MPFFSIIVPAYNNEQYLSSCIESVLRQSYTDLELIVVVDGSLDNSAEVVRNYANNDRRVKLIEKKKNEGRHLARKSGVGNAEGKYGIFLDADDELIQDSLDRLHISIMKNRKADIIHFSAKVFAEGSTTQEEAKVFAEYANQSYRTLFGDEIIGSTFDPLKGFKRDWRVIQRVYEMSLLKNSFGLMTSNRLDRSEDCYEYFVISSLATCEVTDSSTLGYSYFYGRGVTGFDEVSLSQFTKSAREFKDCNDQILSYALKTSSNYLIRCAKGAKAKSLDLLFNDWIVRVSANEKNSAILNLADVIGPTETAAQLMRVVRDKAYEQLLSKKNLNDTDEIRHWFLLAEKLYDNSSTDDFSKQDYLLYKATAESHLNYLKKTLVDQEKRNSESIKIFVSTHKDVELFDSAVLQPVQVGSSMASSRFLNMRHDDEGENISFLNPMYCELTTQYWAWKNIKAKYYGFCHYRRYFDFTQIDHEENEYGEIMDSYIDAESQQRYGLTDETIKSFVEKYDVVTTRFQDLRRFPGSFETPLEQYKTAEKLYFKDLDKVISVLKRMHPDYAEDAEAFLNGNVSCFCNMFIMKREIFFSYCEWLFPILDRFVKETDFSRYSKEALRTPGHLSERLFNIYFNHQVRIGANWKTAQLQCVHFEKPERRYGLSLPVDAKYRPIIPIVFAADGNYAPMVCVTISSLLKNASSDYYYDIFVLEQGIAGDDQEMIRQCISEEGQASIRFYNVSHIVDEYDLTTSNEHISQETYYRFLVQDLLSFYDKVLYLDSDIIIEGDISELFNIDLGDNLLAAAHDVDYQGNLNMPDGERLEYTNKKLQMNDPYSYFQAGVLVLNTKELRALHSVDEWLEIASDPGYIYNDQDILNKYCEGRVTYLDYEWNVMHDCGGRVNSVFSFAPAQSFNSYLESRAHPKIIHYAGYEKPWKYPRCDYSNVYWKYARETPFYEQLIDMLSGYSERTTVGNRLPEPVMSDNNPLRKVVDPIMPLGSRRREVAKAIGRTIRGGSK